jgi:hypothetical protein
MADMRAEDSDGLWVKSSLSGANGNCVEVAFFPESVSLRDSKHPEGPVLRFSSAAWVDFIASIRDGSLDSKSGAFPDRS